MTITAPNITQPWNGTQNISWVSVSGNHTNETFSVYWSANGGATWNLTASNIAVDDVYVSKNYTLDTRAVIDGNVTFRVYRNNTGTGHSESNDSATVTIDNPPASVTNLAANVVNSTAINWTWTNPANADFNNTPAYVDGVFIGNLSNTTAFHLNATFASCTSHTLSLRTQDLAGNVNSTWTNLTATTQCPAPPAPAGGNPGGGGCCGSALVAAAPGEPVVFEMPPNAPIEKIEIVTDEPVQVKVTAKPLAAPPPGAPPPPGPVARFMEVKLTNPLGEPVKAKRVAMEFSVERTWMNQNGVPQERVALARLEGEKWTPYPAKIVSEGAAEVKFKAEVPGTSVFAVTAALPQTPEPSPTARVAPSPVLAPPTPTPAPDDGARAVLPVPTPRSPGFEVALALLAMTVVAELIVRSGRGR